MTGPASMATAARVIKATSNNRGSNSLARLQDMTISLTIKDMITTDRMITIVPRIKTISSHHTVILLSRAMSSQTVNMRTNTPLLRRTKTIITPSLKAMATAKVRRDPIRLTHHNIKLSMKAMSPLLDPLLRIQVHTHHSPHPVRLLTLMIRTPRIAA